MRVFVRRWGDDAAVRLPASVLAAAGLAIDDPVEVCAEEGRIVIERAQPRPLPLEWLLEGVTPENRHEETDWGPPRGREYR